MPSQSFTPQDALYAAVNVIGATGSSAVADGGYREGRATATARTGVGVYTVTLDPGIDAQEAQYTALAVGGAGNTNIQVADTSDTVKTVTVFVGAVATDVNFRLMIRKVRIDTPGS